MRYPINSVMIDGIVGKIERKEAGVFLRLVHKESFFNKKTSEWVKDESWMSIGFFGQKGEAFEREVEVGDRLMIQAGLAVFPKEGPESRLRLNGISFYLLMPYAQKASPGAPASNNFDDDF